MNYFSTPIFLIAFNRLEALLQVIAWLERAGYSNINIIDNASTYPPLLAYLETSPHHVHRMPKNYGHLVLWDSGRFDDIIKHQNFVLSDCDILPDNECPADVVEQLANVLDRYTNFTKVGLSLRINDLPDHYSLKAKVLEWEAPFWEHPLEGGKLYEAALDTTFAYYRPGIGPKDQRWWRSIRTAAPLTARHLPWYANTSQLSQEDIYYQTHLKEMSSQWSTTDPVLLKEQNIKLQAEVHALRRELALLKQSAWGHWRMSVRQRLIRTADRLHVGQGMRNIRNRIFGRWR
ncbi:MAG: hypothetical protein ACN6PE_29135 [Achromobacter marplatensis]|uniref:hypothetical protein n=1 Tax=Achromobacter marplatensis TaxID=470868 RepID=UPI003CFDE432